MNDNSHKNLLILGAGQYGRVAEETAASTGKFDKIAFLDDKNEIAVGKLVDYEKFVSQYKYAFVAMGNADLRLGYIAKLQSAGYEVAVIVSPRAYVAPSASLGCGSIVEAGAVVNSFAALGEGTLVCAGAIVNHNAVVGDGCQIDCGSVVGANAVLPAKTRLGYNETFVKKL